MTKLKKKYTNLSKAELAIEVTRLAKEITRAKVELASGKLKNTRHVFNLRTQLAIVKSYANYNR